MAFIWGQFHKRYLSYHFLKLAYLKLNWNLPGANELTEISWTSIECGTWISNYICTKLWDVINYLSCDGFEIDVECRWIKKFSGSLHWSFCIIHETLFGFVTHSRVRRFANDFHEWRSHEWKSLANRFTSPQKWEYILLVHIYNTKLRRGT